LAVVVFLGESGVGKTCLATRYEKGTFTSNSASTIGRHWMQSLPLVFTFVEGAAFSTTTLELNGALVKIQMWDTGTQ
jgi:GTPase SAR1 family protein